LSIVIHTELCLGLSKYPVPLLSLSRDSAGSLID